MAASQEDPLSRGLLPPRRAVHDSSHAHPPSPYKTRQSPLSPPAKQKLQPPPALLLIQRTMDESEIQIPSFFLCPVSLQIMRDPVTLPTGITYDRESIEHWLYSANQNTCPVTKQHISDFDNLTPNHTLRRLIQSWCTANASSGIERFPTPRPPITKPQISALLDESTRLPNSLLSSLAKLKRIVSESERNKRCVEATPGAIDFLASIISNLSTENEDEFASDEAVSILYSLQLSQQSLRDLQERNQDLIKSLTAILRRSANYQTRAHAVLLIKALIGVVPPSRLISVGQEFFEEIVKVLRDRISYQAMKAALQVLYGVCPWGRNVVKAVKAGAVKVVVELLLDEPEKRACEMMMVVLDELCGCADGRKEVVGHAAGLAVVSKNMVRVSAVATARAVSLVYSISNQAAPAVVEEMLQVGIVSKLCLLLQVECEKSTRKMVKDVLSMHLNVWRRSPCLTTRLKDFDPYHS
ncbi:E3 ubiquitin-protein ligase PUB23-like [Phalaenopsis equestris]|uniref:E3 ubiquitin-protein ligase PUB23-like n=1 Tax=Phalaenopsis equestris TaxID=78828 RepID=UPI0009E40448|nr:E3 ubiquitin-protein ligase PUB23-like [Phalaenopsis equestris]